MAKQASAKESLGIEDTHRAWLNSIYRRRIEDRKMFTILCSAVLYCLIMFTVAVYFQSNLEAFTGRTAGQTVPCFAKKDSDVPTDFFDKQA